MLGARFAIVLAAATLCACGPVQSTSFLMDAETMLEAARTAQAEKLSPYEWTAANLYLHKSKEEVGYADFEQAVDYAKKAVDFATRARDGAVKTVRRSERPGTVPSTARPE
ncbi:MAG: DUF4398 domain-containing protein [Myxococcales bacterium]|nr:DUF4398 domain-containing protein [Myxococcales bacterium]